MVVFSLLLWENETSEGKARRAVKEVYMELGVVVGVAAFCVMAVFAVLVGIIAAVSTVSGIETRDNDGD